MCCFPIFFGFSLKTMSISSVLRHHASNGGKQTEITADMQFKLNNVKGQGASQAGTGPQVVYMRNPCFSQDCFALTIISQAIGSLNSEVPKSPPSNGGKQTEIRHAIQIEQRERTGCVASRHRPPGSAKSMFLP